MYPGYNVIFNTILAFVQLRNSICSQFKAGPQEVNYYVVCVRPSVRLSCTSTSRRGRGGDSPRTWPLVGYIDRVDRLERSRRTGRGREGESLGRQTKEDINVEGKMWSHFSARRQLSGTLMHAEADKG